MALTNSPAQNALISVLMESNSSAVIIFDNDLRVSGLNQAAVEMFGWSLEEAVGAPFPILPDASSPNEPIEESGEEQIVQRRDKRGRILRLKLSSSPIINADGNLCGVVKVFREPEEQGEEKLRRTRQFLRSIIDMTPSFVYVIDSDGRLVLRNRKLAQTFNTTVDDLVGKSVRDIISCDDAAASALWNDSIVRRGEAPRMECEEEYVAPDGQVRSLRTIKMPMRDAHGEMCLLCVSEDISERKEAESALRESEERFAQFMSNIPAAIFIADENSRLLYANQYFRSLFHLRQQYVGVSLAEYLDPQIWGRIRVHDEVALEQGVFATIESIPHGQDNVRYLDAHRFVINRPGKRKLLGGIFIDVTDLKKSEDERKRLEERLLQAMKMEAVGRLAGGVAHDFNNLLSPILGYADLTLMHLDEEDSIYQDLLHIREAAERGATLTRQLLAFSRKQVLDMRNVCLNRAIGEFVTMLRRLIGEDIVLATSLDPKLGTVKADISQVQQMLMNLAVNARDAMPSGGTLIIETANTQLDQLYCNSHPNVMPGSYVTLTVSDTGTGIDPEHMAHIFEPFFTTKARGKGTGLGLATVYGLVKQHGGHLNVYSEPDKGTTFRIYLPRTDDTLEPAPKKSIEQSVGGYETILVVEDEELVRTLAVDVLKSQGYSIISASNAQEAMTRQAEYEGKIDLLLTDVVMPGKNGRELYQTLSALRPDVKVLFMSGYIDDVVEHHGMIESNANFLQKPFTVSGLLQKVRAAIDALPQLGD